MNYIELNVSISPRNPWADILLAQLAEIGFESFVDTQEGIQAYIPAPDFDEAAMMEQTLLGESSEEYQVTFEKIEIEHQNWNALWESDFEPVYVEEALSILAPFHDMSLAKKMNIVIQPQMSFGTGHHQTTWLMSKALMAEDINGKRILDMGTGTGVLAILAEKLGASDILAIDIEDWSVVNTLENAERNACTKIIGKHGDVDLLEGEHFDFILANINKNVLKHQLPSYAECLTSGGKLFLSGFFESDIEEMTAVTQELGFMFVEAFRKESWAALKFQKI